MLGAFVGTRKYIMRIPQPFSPLKICLSSNNIELLVHGSQSNCISSPCSSARTEKVSHRVPGGISEVFSFSLSLH